MRRLIKDESGMTMGLTVIMIVLIGVMGAGLLTFVNRDLESVVEVNQGQRGLEMADAGVEAAKSNLLVDAVPSHYNGGADDSDWSYVDRDGAGSDIEGKTLTLDANAVNVRIRYLPPAPTDAQLGAPDYGPELSTGPTYSGGGAYFRVLSEGTAGNARRKVEAIFRTTRSGLPQTYYATRNITINGAPIRITDTSIFARGKIINPFLATMQGTDRAYGNWVSKFNATPRAGSLAGMAAEGSVIPTEKGINTYQGGQENPQKAGTAGVNQRYGLYDFDNKIGSTYAAAPKFVAPGSWGVGSQPTSQVTYPFDPGRRADLDFLRRIAQENGTYMSRSTTTATITAEGQAGGDSPKYPYPSEPNTVYFIEFTGSTGTVNWQVNTSTLGGLTSRGLVVVVNGNFIYRGSASRFEGPIVIHRSASTPSGTVLTYTAEANSQLDGFTNIEGDLIMGGNSGPFLSSSVLTRPGYYNVEQWSWRECYNITCS